MIKKILLAAIAVIYLNKASAQDVAQFGIKHLTGSENGVYYNLNSPLKGLPKQHPYIMANATDFENLRQRIKTDSLSRSWYNRLKTEADRILDEPVMQHKVIASGRGNIRDIVLKVKNRVMVLSLIYRVSGEEVYARRAWKEMEAAALFPDWCPDHFLDVGEIVVGMAVGYDWIYDYLTDPQRKLIRDAIIEKAFLPAKEIFEMCDQTKWNHTGMQFRWEAWPIMRGNHNSVINGGLAVAAVALGNDIPELAGYMLQRNVHSMEYTLKQFGPDGGWPEGPSYTKLTLAFLGYFLGTLDKALGHTFGTINYPGVSESWKHYLYIKSPLGYSFNFGDAYKELTPSSINLFLANKFNNPVCAGLRLTNTDRVGVEDLLWYNPSNVTYPVDFSVFPKDRYFREVEAVTLRSGWDPKSSFLAVSAGLHDVEHPDMDMGSFIFDALGYRWVEDFGKEDYDLPGFFGPRGRWIYYRKKAEGHNTLLINPGLDLDHEIKSFCRVTSFVPGTSEPFAITDLTDAYRSKASKILRGARLFGNRKNAIIQDQISTPEPSDIYWFLHTAADIELLSGGKAAMLTMGTKKLLVVLNSDQKAVFTVRDAAPMIITPNAEGQTKNYVKKLSIFVPQVRNLSLMVSMFPLNEGDPLPVRVPAMVPLQNWKENVPLNQTALTLSKPSPVMAAPVFASLVAADMNIYPENILDKSIYTYWQAQANTAKGEWICIDTKNSRAVSAVGLAFVDGDQKSVRFSIETSGDSVAWKKVYEGQSSGKTENVEFYRFNKENARFLRVVCYGNNIDNIVKLSTVEIEGFNNTVQNQLERVNLDKFTTLKEGASKQLLFKSYLKDGREADLKNASLRFLTDNKAIAEFSQNGVLTGKTDGFVRVGVEVTIDGIIKSDNMVVEVVKDGVFNIIAREDAFVRDGSVDWNYGNDAVVQVKNGVAGVNTRVGYYKFDLSAVKGEVQSATMFLYGETIDDIQNECKSPLDPGIKIIENSIFAATGPWDEKTVTWSKRPAKVKEIASVGVLRDQPSRWYPVDLTAFVKGETAANRIFTIGIEQTRYDQNVRCDFNSVQNAAYKPYIKVVVKK